MYLYFRYINKYSYVFNHLILIILQGIIKNNEEDFCISAFFGGTT